MYAYMTPTCNENTRPWQCRLVGPLWVPETRFNSAATFREGELSLNDTEEMKAERRRGRKRGKHNFEPGYVRSPPSLPPPRALFACGPLCGCKASCIQASFSLFPSPPSFSGTISDAKDVQRYKSTFHFRILLLLQKEMLFKEWDDFSTKHSRCPKSQEIQSFSEKCFRNRRKELEAEDPHHPLLVILEEPLDAIQVKNLFNNEKKKKKKQARTSTNGKQHTRLGGKPLFFSLGHGS